jgi:hypothetical protein
MSNKYIKMYCGRYDCDTEFLIKVTEKEIPNYYICPECESMVFIDENTKVISL